MSNYADFLASKRVAAPEVGFEVALEDLNPALFGFQRQLVRWALRRGRAALFERVGLGKTLQQLEWARCVHEETGGDDVLILAPLAVAEQTRREGEKFGIQVTVCRESEDLRPGINVTNYDRLDRFDPETFIGVVLDESSILKGFGSRTRWALNSAFADTPYKLCCTATPAPNQHSEIGTHAHFLGVMDHGEMLTRWFSNDTTEARQLRLKKHGERDFWRWVATWAACVNRPSDLRDEDGRPYPDEGFDLPPLVVREHRVTVDHRATQEETGKLFRAATPIAATELYAELRRTTSERVAETVRLVDESHGLEERWLSPKNAKSTTESGTKPTENTSKNTEKIRQREETDAAESATQRTPNTERNVKSPRESETSPGSERPDCAPNSASTPKRTTVCSQSRAEDVQSVAPNSETASSGDCTSITATTEAACGDCCARNATSESASSGTTLSCSHEQHATCRRAEPSLEPWIVWCNTNAEQRELERAFGDRAISVYGSLSPDEKERRLLAFAEGERPILISKPKLAGFGLNYQHCARHVFVGLSFSFEQFHQALGRSHRFGQTRPVEGARRIQVLDVRLPRWTLGQLQQDPRNQETQSVQGSSQVGAKRVGGGR